jgi:hypothetical protein
MQKLCQLWIELIELDSLGEHRLMIYGAKTDGRQRRPACFDYRF